MIAEAIKKRLVEKAKERHGENITPCMKSTVSEDGFMFFGDDSIVFWYNAPDGSTHIVHEEANHEQ